MQVTEYSRTYNSFFVNEYEKRVKNVEYKKIFPLFYIKTTTTKETSRSYLFNFVPLPNLSDHQISKVEYVVALSFKQPTC